MPGRGRDLSCFVVDEYAILLEPPITVIRCPPGTQSLNLAERGQKRLLMLCSPDLHYGRLSLKGCEVMLFVAEGQLDNHPMTHSHDPAQSSVSRLEA